MNELRLEDLERIIGRIIIANYQNEQAMIAQIEMLQKQLAKSEQSNITNSNSQG